MTDRCKRRLPGIGVKQRAELNWIKMYDKAGSVLRVEKAINQPEAFNPLAVIGLVADLTAINFFGKLQKAYLPT